MGAAMRLLRFWAALDSPVDRRTYLLHGLGLAALKYGGDIAIVWMATGNFWSPADYLQSVYSLASARLPTNVLLALGVWTLPFVWLGITLTFRRVLDAGHSCWWAFLFFVPYVNYALMATFAIVPSAEPTLPDQLPRDGGGLIEGVLSITAGVVLALTMVALGVGVFRDYSAALFFGSPFAMGALTGFMFNRRYDASLSQTLRVTTMMFAAVAGIVFLLATEGVLCIAMAMPLALTTGLGGALLGRVIALVGQRNVPPVLYALLVLPLSASLEPAPGVIVHEVQTAIEIEARPDLVWPHVIAFRPIDEPRDWLFRMGIAYPQYATIEGTGIGAVRYCVFSTGAFVEPITHWDAPERLSFNVTASPAPLRELTFSDNVAPPHLDGYLRPQRGEFRLVPLPGGRTRLEGSTWYELAMGPEWYWQMFSDYLIERIHRRVLEHIKNEVEDP